MNSIPLIDLKAAHAQVADEVRAGFDRILANTAFIGGEEVAAFEREYAAFGGVRHCVGVANGTDALELALRAVGVGPGDEVVVPANTFFATAEAVARAGATTIFADCDPRTYLLDVQAALAAVSNRTKAIIPVHLYGQMAPAEELTAALTGSKVRVVEDAAQSQGASRNGRTAGSGAGAIAGTSFYPGKNLGAYGDAGGVVTDDPELEDAVRTMANHGGRTKYAHDVMGFNSRLDALQAVVLRAKLARLAEWNEARRAAATRYDELFAGNDAVVLPVTLAGNVHVWHQYVVKIGEPGADGARRDEVVGKLNAEGIGAGVHYPHAVHRTAAFAAAGHGPGSFPAAEDAAARILSLPMHPHLTAADQERVAEALLAALR